VVSGECFSQCLYVELLQCFHSIYLSKCFEKKRSYCFIRGIDDHFTLIFFLDSYLVSAYAVLWTYTVEQEGVKICTRVLIYDKQCQLCCCFLVKFKVLVLNLLMCVHSLYSLELPFQFPLVLLLCWYNKNISRKIRVLCFRRASSLILILLCLLS
jgi:hypothetical protein